MKAIKLVGFIAASLALGEVITRCTANLSIDTPHINQAIQWGGIALFNRMAASDPDVVFDVGTIMLAAASTVFSGIVICVVWRVFRSDRHSLAVRG